MTSVEIKQNLLMTDLLSRYGIKVRNNMCRCPFHGKDQHPSMKVFKDGAKCFACGWNGDQFSFVMDMEHVDFRTAFLILGGEYEQKKDKALYEAKYQAKKEESERKKRKDEEFKHEISECIKICKTALEVYEPMSDGWCEAYNDLQYLNYHWEQKYIEEQEIEDINVHRRCKQIRQRFL